jgi:hypothetical protein
MHGSSLGRTSPLDDRESDAVAHDVARVGRWWPTCAVEIRRPIEDETLQRLDVREHPMGRLRDGGQDGLGHEHGNPAVRELVPPMLGIEREQSGTDVLVHVAVLVHVDVIVLVDVAVLVDALVLVLVLERVLVHVRVVPRGHSMHVVPEHPVPSDVDPRPDLEAQDPEQRGPQCQRAPTVAVQNGWGVASHREQGHRNRRFRAVCLPLRAKRAGGSSPRCVPHFASSRSSACIEGHRSSGRARRPRSSTPSTDLGALHASVGRRSRPRAAWQATEAAESPRNGRAATAISQ